MLSPSAAAKDRNRRSPFTSFKASLGLQMQSVTARGFGKGPQPTHSTPQGPALPQSKPGQSCMPQDLQVRFPQGS